MARIFPALAALLVAVTAPVTAAAPFAATTLRSEASRSMSTRFGGGASASATISARIIRGAARVGPGLGPPAHAMVPRRATLSAADGSPVAALVYDFE
jgi:hypothetical protein